MKTDALIEALAADLRPVSRAAVQRRLGTGFGIGAVATLLIVIGLLGADPALRDAALDVTLWLRSAGTFALALTGFYATVQLARPDCAPLRGVWIGASLLLVVVLAVATRPLNHPVSGSWTCVPMILGLAVPPFAGLVWALRGLAPTRLWSAGAAAGLAAGGLAATLYALHQPVIAPIHVFARCAIAVALAVPLGALAGSKLLRW